jgi:hypothetical protein
MRRLTLDDALTVLRQDFTSALSDWDASVEASVEDDDNNLVSISFSLWGHDIYGQFYRDGRGRWLTPDDSPHEVANEVGIWRWISMRMADMLDRRPTMYEKDVRPLLASIRQNLAPTERAAVDPAVLDLVELYPALASDA